MNPINSLRFRDIIKQHFKRDLMWQAPLDERAGQQNARDLIATKQGLYSGNIALEAPKVFPGLDATSADFDGVTSLLRSVGGAGDFAFITEEANWQIHFFVKSDQTKTQVFLATEALSAGSNIGDGFALYEVLVPPTLDKAIRFAYIRQGITNPMATTANNFIQPNRPLFFTLVRSAGVLSLFCNSVLVPWATNTIGTLSRVAPQLYPLSVGCAPAGVANGANAKLQHPFIVRGERPEPQGDVDFVYREAIRGMSLWDWFSHAYPESDLFLEFDEPSGTTLVNRANGNGQYFGNIELQQARISSRTGLSAKFDGSSAYAEIPEQCNCIQRTAVFSMGVIIKRDEESTADHWIYSTGVEDGETGFDWFLNQSGAVTFRVRGNSVTISQVFDAGVSFDTGQDYFIAMTGNGTNLFLYVDGVLKDTKPATVVAENATRDLLIGLDQPSGSIFSPFTLGLAFITTTTMPAHEVMHLHKLTELGGYFDRPDEFLEYDITTGETPLPEPPPPGDEGYLLTEDGFILTTENGERIVIEDAP
jgi:hypothetical protein